MTRILPSARIEEDPVVLSYRPASPAVVSEPPPVPYEAAPEVRIAPPSLPEEAVAQRDPEPSLEDLRREARERGHREGYETGYEAGEREAKEHLAREREGALQERESAEKEAEALRALLASMRTALDARVEGLEDEMVEIAFTAACKVLGEAALTAEGVRAMVRESMRLVRSRDGAVVRVSPADFARLAPDDAGAKVVADERVEAGGCMIETSGGTLDARLEVQLRALLDTLARERAAGADR